ncbi:MAG: hypothetical protein AAF458_00625 [Pseudomonadota bacterium]
MQIIDLTDFVNPTVLDFESQSNGAIAATDPLFTSFGITSLTATGTSDADIYSEGGGTRALFYSEQTGFLLDESGRPELPMFATDGLSYTLVFNRLLNRIGFGTPDHGAGIDIEFRNGTTLVENFTQGRGSNSSPTFYGSSVAFDRITVSSTTPGLGFGLDNITLEAATAPAPGPAALLGLGLLALSFGKPWRRR